MVEPVLEEDEQLFADGSNSLVRFVIKTTREISNSFCEILMLALMDTFRAGEIAISNARKTNRLPAR